MSASEKEKSALGGAVAGTGSTFQEALLGLVGGVAYGMVSPVAGHPIDTVKTKMQVEPAFKNATILQTVAGTYRMHGIIGFYRGFFPPLLGSVLYRGAGFSAYSGAYSACAKVPVLHEPIPFTGGLKSSVVIGAIAAGSTRAIIESPLDFIKLRNQIGEGVMQDASHANNMGSSKEVSIRSFLSSPIHNIRHLYHGFSATLLSRVSLYAPFFIGIDYAVRYIPDVVNAPLIGPFFKGGICATLSWTFAFPFETAKSVIQGDTTGKYKNRRGATWEVLKALYKEGGIRRLYRGFGPGAGRSFVANGASMIAYSWFQEKAREDR